MSYNSCPSFSDGSLPQSLVSVSQREEIANHFSLLKSNACGTSGGYYECAQGDLAGHLRVWLKWQHDVMNTRAGCIEEGVISLVMLFGNEGTER